MKYHFIGIGGVGMSALARIMLQKGYTVTGSDSKESYVTKALEKAGAKISYVHRKENIESGSVVVYSSAIKKDNPEWVSPMLHRSDLLQQLLDEKKAILIVGAHGKTTSTSLLAHISKSRDPSFVVGGFSPSLGDVNGYIGRGEYFIAEGDESDGSFLKATPAGAIITNVDFDHLDYWKTKEALLASYQRFIAGVPNLLFYRYEDPYLSQWKVKGISFGESDKADLQVKDVHSQMFTIVFQGKTYSDIKLSLLGRHNVFNAAGCFGMAMALGMSEEKIREGLISFKGVKRRLELKGTLRGALIYDDYAHHPKEIEATLAAIKGTFQDRRKVAVFQPHRYTRLKDLMDDFANAWKDADELIVTDIYSAGESTIEGVSIEAFLKKVKRNKVTYIARDELVEFLQSNIASNDVVVTLGAGDITKVGSDLVYD